MFLPTRSGSHSSLYCQQPHLDDATPLLLSSSFSSRRFLSAIALYTSSMVSAPGYAGMFTCTVALSTAAASSSSPFMASSQPAPMPQRDWNRPLKALLGLPFHSFFSMSMSFWYSSMAALTSFKMSSLGLSGRPSRTLSLSMFWATWMLLSLKYSHPDPIPQSFWCLIPLGLAGSRRRPVILRRCRGPPYGGSRNGKELLNPSMPSFML
mmetsp:Transcript_12669/g.29146  ORF Transcript_12669/g.29146 Transcript_12669/m.29146 type:complete len:209 (-) Transcript_12669:192-818(-)